MKTIIIIIINTNWPIFRLLLSATSDVDVDLIQILRAIDTKNGSSIASSSISLIDWQCITVNLGSGTVTEVHIIGTANNKSNNNNIADFTNVCGLKSNLQPDLHICNLIILKYSPLAKLWFLAYQRLHNMVVQIIYFPHQWVGVLC